MPWWQILLCVLYVVSPLDLVPDVIPVLGWLDDIGVLGYLIHCLCQGKPGGEAAGPTLTGPS